MSLSKQKRVGIVKDDERERSRNDRCGRGTHGYDVFIDHHEGSASITYEGMRVGRVEDGLTFVVIYPEAPAAPSRCVRWPRRIGPPIEEPFPLTSQVPKGEFGEPTPGAGEGRLS